ncbi:MAG: hypothetical protein COB04_11905 [Gammaproteobacteria bacterium]|nr:MAG: hypothetical protein COB04_11905 [Gammaproteobacteria bacterium]
MISGSKFSNVEIGGESKITEIELQKGQAIANHSHDCWVEHCYCLSGELMVYLEGDFKVKLTNGEKLQINSRSNHKILNVSEGVSNLLIIQDAVRPGC